MTELDLPTLRYYLPMRYHHGNFFMPLKFEMSNEHGNISDIDIVAVAHSPFAAFVQAFKFPLLRNGARFVKNPSCHGELGRFHVAP